MKKETIANLVLICAIIVIVVDILILTGIIGKSMNSIVIVGIVVGGCLVYLSDIIRKGKK